MFMTKLVKLKGFRLNWYMYNIFETFSIMLFLFSCFANVHLQVATATRGEHRWRSVAIGGNHRLSEPQPPRASTGDPHHSISHLDDPRRQDLALVDPCCTRSQPRLVNFWQPDLATRPWLLRQPIL